MTQSNSLCLLVSAGNGPPECHQAVAHILDRMNVEAARIGLGISIERTESPYGAKSAVVVLHGDMRQSFAKTWRGTIQWRMQSQVRRHHKRSNWFVGVFDLAPAAGTCDINPKDVTFSTLRAGGPGGQHQNTTDSAVRAHHRPTGLKVVVRDARSQHRNKAAALSRLQSLADAQACAHAEQRKNAQNRLHHALERGNPIRRFKGADFTEDQQ